MRRSICLVMATALALNLTGCTALQKKFTPKKKKQAKMPRVYQFKEYEKKPTPELYQKHYAYWMTWQSELIKVLGDNGKKDKRCIQEILGNLRDMQALLVDEKGDEMEPHIKRLDGIKSKIFSGGLTQANKDDIRRVLEKEDRVIKREFCLRKMRSHLRKNFEDEPADDTVKAVTLAGEEAAAASAEAREGPQALPGTGSVVFLKGEDAGENR